MGDTILQVKSTKKASNTSSFPSIKSGSKGRIFCRKREKMAFARITLLLFSGSFVHFMRLLRFILNFFLLLRSTLLRFCFQLKQVQRRPILLSLYIFQTGSRCIQLETKFRTEILLSLLSATPSLWYIPIVMMQMLNKQKKTNSSLETFAVFI